MRHIKSVRAVTRVLIFWILCGINPASANSEGCLKVSFSGDPLFIAVAQSMFHDAYVSAGYCLEPLSLPMKRSARRMTAGTLDGLAYQAEALIKQSENGPVFVPVTIFKTAYSIVYAKSDMAGHPVTLESFRGQKVGYFLGSEATLRMVNQIGGIAVPYPKMDNFVELISRGRIRAYLTLSNLVMDAKAKNKWHDNLGTLALPSQRYYHLLQSRYKNMIPKLKVSFQKIFEHDLLVDRYFQELAKQ